MGGLSIWHWMIVLAVVLLLFGGSGKVSTLMGDFAKGMKSFKKNMADDEPMEQAHASTAAHPAPTSLASPSAPVQSAPVQSVPVQNVPVQNPPPQSAPVQEPARHI